MGLSELYDLRADPLEQRNLIEVRAYHDQVEAMRARLHRGDRQAAERKLH